MITEFSAIMMAHVESNKGWSTNRCVVHVVSSGVCWLTFHLLQDLNLLSAVEHSLSCARDILRPCSWASDSSSSAKIAPRLIVDFFEGLNSSMVPVWQAFFDGPSASSKVTDDSNRGSTCDASRASSSSSASMGAGGGHGLWGPSCPDSVASRGSWASARTFLPCLPLPGGQIAPSDGSFIARAWFSSQCSTDRIHVSRWRCMSSSAFRIW
mmetsp:Transcript_124670/g.364109  ORF Transcript_124670/g.364109 Transcript_124670/m.364109 type:complete len:211 (+) Transcript_124670:1495-2127(+)